MNNPRVAIDSQRLPLWTAVVGSIAYIAIAWSKNFDLVLTCESKAFNCKMSVWQDRQR